MVKSPKAPPLVLARCGCRLYNGKLKIMYPVTVYTAWLQSLSLVYVRNASHHTHVGLSPRYILFYHPMGAVHFKTFLFEDPAMSQLATIGEEIFELLLEVRKLSHGYLYIWFSRQKCM